MRPRYERGVPATNYRLPSSGRVDNLEDLIRVNVRPKDGVHKEVLTDPEGFFATGMFEYNRYRTPSIVPL